MGAGSKVQQLMGELVKAARQHRQVKVVQQQEQQVAMQQGLRKLCTRPGLQGGKRSRSSRSAWMAQLPRRSSLMTLAVKGKLVLLLVLLDQEEAYNRSREDHLHSRMASRHTGKVQQAVPSLRLARGQKVRRALQTCILHGLHGNRRSRHRHSSSHSRAKRRPRRSCSMTRQTGLASSCSLKHGGNVTFPVSLSFLASCSQSLRTSTWCWKPPVLQLARCCTQHSDCLQLHSIATQLQLLHRCRGAAGPCVQGQPCRLRRERYLHLMSRPTASQQVQ